MVCIIYGIMVLRTFDKDTLNIFVQSYRDNGTFVQMIYLKLDWFEIYVCVTNIINIIKI
jgi:hypothetical protein